MVVWSVSTVVAVGLYRLRIKAKNIIRWPQIEVRVVPGSIVFAQAGWMPFSSKRGFRIAAIEYEYRQNGLAHLNRKILPVNWTIREEEQQRVQRELEGFAVAFCNPADPADTYLDIPDRWKRGSISWVTVGLVFFGLISVLLGRTLLALYL